MRTYLLMLAASFCLLFSAVQAQHDIVLNGLKNDTIQIRLDTVKNNLIVTRTDRLFSNKEFSLQKNDSGSWSIKNKADLFFQMLHVYATDSIQSVQQVMEQLKDTTAMSVIFTEPAAKFQPPVNKPGRQTEVPGYSNIFVYGLALAGLLFLALFLWFYFKWNMLHEQARAIEKRGSAEFGIQLHEYLQQRFPQFFSAYAGKKDAHHLLKRLEDELLGSAEKINRTETLLQQIKLQLQQERENAAELHAQKVALENEKVQMAGKQAAELASVKSEVNRLSEQMLARYISFTKQVKEGSDEDKKRLILSFHIGYAQMSNAVFRHLAATGDDASGLNIRLLKGEPVEPRRTVDQFTSMNDVNYWVVLLIKLLEANGVRSIEDVYIHGDKIQLKD